MKTLIDYEQKAKELISEIRTKIEKGSYAYNPKSIYNEYSFNCDRAVRSIALWHVKTLAEICEPFEGDYFDKLKEEILKQTKI